MELSGLFIAMCSFLFAQRGKKRHDILDLFRRQDRLAAPARPTRVEAIDAIIGRHDRRRIEARGIDQPQPQLAFGPAAAGAGEARREIALEPGFGERPAMAENAGAAAIERPARVRARHRPARRSMIPEWRRRRRVGPQALRAGRSGHRERRCREPRTGIWMSDLAKSVHRDRLEPGLRIVGLAPAHLAAAH